MRQIIGENTCSVRVRLSKNGDLKEVRKKVRSKCEAKREKSKDKTRPKQKTKKETGR